MSKTGFKSFVYSFSVSLLTIMAVNRALLCDEPLSDNPLNIDDKNIVLFLKNIPSTNHPVKKIALNSLPDIEAKRLTIEQVEPANLDIVLAENDELIDFPLEIAPNNAEVEKSTTSEAKEIVLADVLYSPETPLETGEIALPMVYTPEEEINRSLTPPKIIKKDTVKAVAKNDDTAKTVDNKPSIELAQADEDLLIPLQSSSKMQAKHSDVRIGNSKDLNHVALNSKTATIESMKEHEEETPLQENKDWIKLNDNPWIVAKSAGGTKNQMALKDYAKGSNKDISQALDVNKNTTGVEVASETVKNLIIPIPNEIMNKDNLTPKLAYPSSSDDAVKEKNIDAKIKQQTSTENKEKSLLSPIDEDIVLETPIPADAKENKEQSTPDKKTSADKKEKDSGGIMGAINSIFKSSKKLTSEAKDKAIAKAQAKRFIKKKALAKPVSIMPTEIRLSFQPNKAEISGQTLRWVQAFATKAAESPNVNLEIRIDGTHSMELQQKRLNLLHNILTHKGVEYSKINTVFTSREPNSFILRTINLKNNSGGTNRKTNGQNKPAYIQW